MLVMHAMTGVCERLSAVINPTVKDVFKESPIENTREVEEKKPARRGVQTPYVPGDKEDRRGGIAYESNPIIRLVRRQPFQSSLLNSLLFRGVGHSSLTARILFRTPVNDNRDFSALRGLHGKGTYFHS